MRHFPPPRRFLLVSLLVALSACKISNGSIDAGAGGAGGDGAGGALGACATSDDCIATCPADALGCACLSGPGGSLCVRTCTAAAQCPPALTCDLVFGICVHAASTSTGACTSPADCVGHCPQGSKACTCFPGPAGATCVPTCSMNGDCPMMGQNLICDPVQGICIPKP